MTGLYPGIGLTLNRASDTDTQEPYYSGGSPTATIPTTKSSVGVPLNAGMTTSVNVLFGTAPAGTAFSVMYDVQPDFSTEFALSAVPVVGTQKAYVWSTVSMVELDGFLRITNSGGQDITKATVQQRARTDG